MSRPGVLQALEDALSEAEDAESLAGEAVTRAEEVAREPLARLDAAHARLVEVRERRRQLAEAVDEERNR